MQEQHDKLRQEREIKEEEDRQRELEQEKIRKEKAAALEIQRAEAAEAHAEAMARKAAEPVEIVEVPEDEDVEGEDGWKKQGPGKAPVASAAADGEAAPGVWKPSGERKGVEGAFGGGAARRPTFGGDRGGDRAGGDGGGDRWKGSRGGDAPAPVRAGGDWGGGGGGRSADAGRRPETAAPRSENSRFASLQGSGDRDRGSDRPRDGPRDGARGGERDSRGADRGSDNRGGSNWDNKDKKPTEERRW